MPIVRKGKLNFSVMNSAHCVLIRAERSCEKKMWEGTLWIYTVQMGELDSFPCRQVPSANSLQLCSLSWTSPFFSSCNLASISTILLRLCKTSSFLVEFKPFFQCPTSLFFQQYLTQHASPSFLKHFLWLLWHNTPLDLWPRLCHLLFLLPPN